MIDENLAANNPPFNVKYGFSKSKIPKGMSYPLKRSMLDAALDEAGIFRLHMVYYFLRQSGQNVMRADYAGESRQAAAAGRSSVTVYAVPSDERKQTESLILATGLPRVCQWLKNIENGGDGLRSKDRHLVIEYAGDKLLFREF